MSDVKSSPPERYQRSSYAVWEITLKCNLACSHCGSRAGEQRSNELSTAEALNLVEQMAECGIREVTLIGGEAFLRRDWLDIARAITDAGMICTLTSGGYGISERTVEKMLEAGIRQVSISIDGLRDVHDSLRGVEGSWDSCWRTIGHLRKCGMPFSTNTQVNRRSAPEIPLLVDMLCDAKAVAWQVQLTVPMGNAVESNQILMQPAELVDLYEMLAIVVEKANSSGTAVLPGNNIGYYGPYEELFRQGGSGRDYIWSGCQAGLYAIGIEADGTIKGCPSLPTSVYAGGNIREYSLRDIALNAPQMLFNTGLGTPKATEHLWGFCSTCDYAKLCRGGCSWTAHVFFDRRGNNPYCHHRALTQKRRGKRERFWLKRGASGLPFDNGEFEMIEEPWNAPWPQEDLAMHFTFDKVQWPEHWKIRPRVRSDVQRAPGQL
jgi:radical SAM protein with 4Fe4S-binding SPASM domain